MAVFKRAALYARFSSDLQRTESIDAQIRAMKKYCVDNNLQVVKIYTDEALSGKSVTKRKGFLEMIDESGSDLFDVVIVHKLDRFARNRYDSAIYKAKLRKNGVEVYSVLEQLNGSPESIMLEALLEGMNEYYSKNLAREVMKGMKENAYQCKHTGGPPPLGFDIDDEGHLKINEEEAETVRIIYDLYTKGYGYSYILDMLNEEGRMTKRGVPFGKNSLYQIIINEKNAGVYVYNKVAAENSRKRRNNHLYKEEDEVIRIPGGCPAIVSKETFDKAMKRVERQKNHRFSTSKDECYLLTGVINCGECGHSMFSNKHTCGAKKYLHITYRCRFKRNHCCNKEINREYLEDYVIGLLEQHIFSRSGVKRNVAAINNYIRKANGEKEKVIQQFSQRITEITESIANLTRLVESGTISQSIAERINELEEEKTNLTIQMDKTSSLTFVYEAEFLRLIDEYNDLPYKSIEYREYVQKYIVNVEVRQFDLDVTIRTGMGIIDDLDKTFTIRRQELYEAFNSTVRKTG